MRTRRTNWALGIFISLTLHLWKCEAYVVSEPNQSALYNATNSEVSICHSGFMSVYASKVQFENLPFTLYVHDHHGRYYQAVAMAKHCNYFLRESDSFIILTVAHNGCFVRREKSIRSLTVVIVKPANKGKVEIVKTLPLICEMQTKANKIDYLPESRQHFCNRDGFNITILQNAAVPHLNLNEVWIPSGQDQNQNCKPQKRSTNAVTFSFAYTDCGSQSVIADGIITYTVNVEVNRHLQKGTIYRDAPFHLAVHCSFALTQRTQLSIELKKEQHASPLSSKGILRTEMRFAKDSSYTSFYPSHDRPIVTELGQSVYVDVFILKHQDKELVLLLEDCWATPTKYPQDPQRWNLLVKGCPFSGDTHRTAVLPVLSSEEVISPSHHKRFAVKMFTFAKARTPENLVYFHCDIKICKGQQCLQTCNNGRHKLRTPSG